MQNLSQTCRVRLGQHHHLCVVVTQTSIVQLNFISFHREFIGRTDRTENFVFQMMDFVFQTTHRHKE